MPPMTAALGGPAVQLHNIDLNISIAKLIKIRPSFILTKPNHFHTWGCNQLLLMETGTAEVVVLATFLTVFAQFLGHHFAVVGWVAVGATDYVLLDGRGGQSGLRRGRLLNIHSRWIG